MSDLHWLQFLHKSVMADDRNECLLWNFGNGSLAIRITHKTVEDWYSHQHIYTADDQRNPEIMIRGVMDQARALNNYYVSSRRESRNE